MPSRSAGGQGRNPGIGDAGNLAGKLAAVLHRRADDRLLETYEPERIAFARRLVATTDRAFTGVTSSTATARALRLHVVPFLLPALLTFRAFRRECLRDLVLYRGFHRFIPTLLKMRGYRVVEIPVNHRPRRFGQSKYGIMNRAVVAFADLLVVRWMKRRRLRYQIAEDLGGDLVRE